MDVYSFINSKAISEHCRKIAHQFTPLEMAYLVYANDSMNIAQKHTAFNEIIEQYPDMEVAERTWTPYAESLHDFLETYMELQNKYLAVFYLDEPCCVYSYEIWYASDDDYGKDLRLYADWNSCHAAILADIKDLADSYKDSDIDVSPIGIRVTKQWVNAADDEHAKYLRVCMDRNGNPTDIWESRCIIAEEDDEILSAFDGLWPEIPTPFSKGDILVGRTRGKHKAEPFVLDWIPYWDEDGKYTQMISYMRENGDCSDMAACIYGQDKDGATWHDHGPSYLNMEFCERELEGRERFLIAVSNHIKGELPLELLIRSYDVLKAEYHAKEERSLIGSFYGSLLEKAGLDNK